MKTIKNVLPKAAISLHYSAALFIRALLQVLHSLFSQIKQMAVSLRLMEKSMAVNCLVNNIRMTDICGDAL
mgnify:CR=1 FL=1